MKIKLAVITALVALLKVLAETYLPGMPISAELINSVLVILCGWLSVEIVELIPPVQKLTARLRERGLW